MNLEQTKQLLEMISAIDNRQITVSAIDAWHQVVGEYEFDDAREALKVTRKQEAVKWIEPRHLIANIKPIILARVQAAEKAERDKPREKVPHPICIHNLKVLRCSDCARTMSQSTNPNKTFFELTGIRINENWQ